MSDQLDISPSPLKLRWVGQGRVAWRRDWVNKYGPTRSHLPGMDQHIGFANFDLQHNGLAPIAKDAAGDPYLLAVGPFTEPDMARIHADVRGFFVRPERTNQYFTDNVLRPLRDLAVALDFAAYHGFLPAEDSPGLQYLRTLFPPQDYEVKFPDGPEAGL